MRTKDIASCVTIYARTLTYISMQPTIVVVRTVSENSYARINDTSHGYRRSRLLMGTVSCPYTRIAFPITETR